MRRTDRRGVLAVAGVLAALVTACAEIDLPHVPPLAEIPLGTEIRARVDRDWARDELAIGGRIPMTILEATRDGSGLEETGSTVLARVTSLDWTRDGVARLRLAFDRIRLGGELYPIRAAVLRVETMPGAARRFVARPETRTGLRGPLTYGSPVAFEGGDPAVIPAGTIFTVQLTESLLIDCEHHDRGRVEGSGDATRSVGVTTPCLTGTGQRSALR